MTFIIKVRGAATPTTIADYLCEEHGRFEMSVDRTPQGDAPDTIPCPDCGASCIWVISAPLGRVKRWEVVRGGWSKPERPTHYDTRELGEGMELHEWQDKRRAIRDQERLEMVHKMARGDL